MEKKIPVTTDVKNLRHFNIYNKSTVQFEPTFVSTGRQIEAIANTKPNEIAIIEINKENLLAYIKDTNDSAYKVMIIWIVLTITLSILHLKGILSVSHMVIIASFFYVCDLICVLIWCPFRLIMNNKCCTTCRIFNWDHLMMFLPMITVNSFFSWTLVTLAVIIWFIWEVCVFTYPERFWENSNMALKCSECTDKLCTQYCRKLRKTEREDKI